MSHAFARCLYIMDAVWNSKRLNNDNNNND